MMIQLDSVTKVFNQGAENQVIALDKVNLVVTEKEMVCIQGPSGSGKTTLLSIIGCIFSPTSGSALIAGKRVSRLPDHFLTRYRRELIGFVFQNFNLLDHLTVVENITLPLLPLGFSPRQRQMKAELLLERFSISHRKKFPTKQLSGGELQRVAIARALVNDPPIIVADEPTAHLDTSLSLDIMDMLAGLKHDGRTVVITSHDPVVAGHLGVDRIIDAGAGSFTPFQSGG